MTDQEVIHRFESGAVPESAFHHADHVRLAFAYLRNYPALTALEKFSTALKQFASSHGKAQLYHETITWAYVSSLPNASRAAPQNKLLGMNSLKIIPTCWCGRVEFSLATMKTPR